MCDVQFSNDGTILVIVRQSKSPWVPDPDTPINQKVTELWDPLTGRVINQKVTDSFPPRGGFPFRKGRLLLSLESEALWVGDRETGKERYRFPNVPSLAVPGDWTDPGNTQ